MQEIWKNIQGWEDCYFVSNLGNFKSIGKIEVGPRRTCKRKDKFLHPQKDTAVYLGIKGKSAHRLVALNFIPNPENKPFVNHINGIKTDNRVENLEWCTRSENAIHSFKIGLQCNKGNNHPSHKLTEKEVLEIRSMHIPKIYGCVKISRKYNVSKQTIKDVLSRKTWNHI